MTTSLNDRSHSLMDEFFHKEDQKLIQQMREFQKFEEHKAALAKASGIKNESILKKLTELKIEPAALAALMLVPLVEVAWADGEVDEKERAVILSAAEKSGLAKESPQYALLEQWIQKRSDPRLMKAWSLYVEGLCEELSGAQINALKSEVMGMARAIAEASGGIMGLGMKTSSKETQILQKLETAFKK
jgi:hypothetical protein